MEDKIGLLSLRKKRSVRPKISNPRPTISAPTVTSLPPAAERPAIALQGARELRKAPEDAENTAEYVKRRYSTRVHALPPILTDAPTLPTIPDQYDSNQSLPLEEQRRRSIHAPVATPQSLRSPTEKIDVNFRALQDPDLRAEQYVAHILANASESEIRDYQHELNRLKNRTSTDIQHNVYENRNQFMKISQEADKLKTEMRALRTMMSDLATTLGQTNAALGISTEAAKARYAHRSSVANLESMWSSQLQELWRRVEGSQKYLPAIPGRHIVHESGRWVELNTATLRPRRRVHLVLLNDHLLVAVEKVRPQQPTGNDTERVQDGGAAQAAQSSHYYTDKCFPLRDIEVSDITTRRDDDPRRGNAMNAINIRHDTESFTYTVPSAEAAEKAAFLAKIRKELADLRNTALANGANELVGPGTPRPISLLGRMGSRLSGVNGVDGGSGLVNKSGLMVEVEGGRQQPFRWLEVQVDELDIDIALRHFSDAVDGVERLRRIGRENKGNAAVQEVMNGKVTELTARLARALIKEMMETSAWLAPTQIHVGWLSRLGFEGRASEAFLTARGEVLDKRIAQTLHILNLPLYLHSLSYITFTMVRNTLSTYQACFPPSMTSAAVVWAKQHVEKFNALLGLHLRKMDPQSEERRECLESVREHAGLLTEIGIDFRALIGGGLGGEGGG